MPKLTKEELQQHEIKRLKQENLKLRIKEKQSEMFKAEINYKNTQKVLINDMETLQREKINLDKELQEFTDELSKKYKIKMSETIIDTETGEIIKDK